MHLDPSSQRRRRKADVASEPVVEPQNIHRNQLVWATGPDGPKPRSVTEAATECGTSRSKSARE